jgi:hypothetical protein
MGSWTHNICACCWNKKNPDKPTNLCMHTVKEDEAVCCFCGQTNYDGIYVREHPDDCLCKGNHD